MIRTLVICVLVISVAGLGDAEASTEGSSHQSIVDGVPAYEDDAIVALIADSTVFCTGVLVAPRVVVTAGHCVGGVEQVHFGQNPTGEDGSTIEVAYQESHPEFDRSSLSADIGVLILAQPAPDSIVPVAIAQQLNSEELRSQPLRALGYGAANPYDSLPPTKRQGLVLFDQLNVDTLRYTNELAAICFGDSGGPTLFGSAGNEVWIGIHSSGDAACTEFGRDTRVDFFAGYLQPFLETECAGSCNCEELATGYSVCQPDETAGPPPPVSGGCHVSQGSGSSGWWMLFLLLLIRASSRLRSRR